MSDSALFNIRNGNVCSLCEKQLIWLYSTTNGHHHGPEVVPLHAKRAIYSECYINLKKRMGDMEVKHSD